jgi:hypothetical protein
MTVDRLDKFLYEIRLQPMWRREADLDCEYYDGNQLDHATLDDMQRLGMAPLIRNLIRPTIDVASGWRRRPGRLARAGGRREVPGRRRGAVGQAERGRARVARRPGVLGRLRRAVEDQASAGSKSRARWTRSSIRTGSPRSVVAKSSGTGGRRSLTCPTRATWCAGAGRTSTSSSSCSRTRRRWSGVGWSKANWDTPLTDFPAIQGRTWLYERDVTIPESDWRDSTRKRLCLYEVWYRVWTARLRDPDAGWPHGRSRPEQRGTRRRWPAG